MVSLQGCDPGFVARDQETNRLFLDSPVGLRGTSLAPYFGHGCRHRAHPSYYFILSRRFGRPRR